MIVCGWCGRPTRGDPCGSCGHEDPTRPWVQRGQEPPSGEAAAKVDNARRLADARTALIGAGQKPTVAALAEHLGVDDRTIRRWKSA